MIITNYKIYDNANIHFKVKVKNGGLRLPVVPCLEKLHATYTVNVSFHHFRFRQAFKKWQARCSRVSPPREPTHH
jgi:hypothetical protein